MSWSNEENSTPVKTWGDIVADQLLPFVFFAISFMLTAYIAFNAYRSYSS